MRRQLRRLLGAAVAVVLAGLVVSCSRGPRGQPDSGHRSVLGLFHRSRQEATIPAGTRLAVRLDSTLSTNASRRGDEVQAELAEPLVAEGRTIVPAGTPARGEVEDVVPSGRLAGQAQLAVSLTELDVGGSAVPVSTSAYRRVGPKHTAHNAKTIGGGAVVGALIGQLVGHDSRSTLRGAAVGAAAGTGVAAATGKLDFALTPGTVLTFTLEQPVTVELN